MKILRTTEEKAKELLKERTEPEIRADIRARLPALLAALIEDGRGSPSKQRAQFFTRSVGETIGLLICFHSAFGST